MRRSYAVASPLVVDVATDAQLVARCRNGDPAAWNELVERFSRYVYAIAVQAFRLSPQDAEDVFQEVFARVYQHLDRLRDDAAIRPWIAQLTRRALHRPAAGGRPRIAGRHGRARARRGGRDARRAGRGAHGAGRARRDRRPLPRHPRPLLCRDESYKTIGEALDIAGRDDCQPDLPLPLEAQIATGGKILRDSGV